MEADKPDGGSGGIAVRDRLDMDSGKGREYLRTCISAGLVMSEDDLRFYCGSLKAATKKALEESDSREVNSCVRTAVSIMSLIQSDQQFAAKLDTEAKGLAATVNVQLNVIQVAASALRNI